MRFNNDDIEYRQVKVAPHELVINVRDEYDRKNLIDILNHIYEALGRTSPPYSEGHEIRQFIKYLLQKIDK